MAAAPLLTKSRIFITGPPGVGKTTLIMRVLESLEKLHSRVQIHGFYTRELRNAESKRIGFEAVTIGGRAARIAGISNARETPASQMVGKYTVNVAEFEAVVMPELAVLDREGKVFVVDEVGRMELFSSAFFPAVWEVLESPAAVVLGTIPVPKRGREISEVERIWKRDDVAVYSVNKGNRDEKTRDVIAHVTSLLKLS